MDPILWGWAIECRYATDHSAHRLNPRVKVTPFKHRHDNTLTHQVTTTAKCQQLKSADHLNVVQTACANTRISSHYFEILRREWGWRWMHTEPVCKYLFFLFFCKSSQLDQNMEYIVLSFVQYRRYFKLSSIPGSTNIFEILILLAGLHPVSKLF